MFKNVATKIALFAFDTTTGVPKSGDAANLTAYVSKDYGAVTVLADTTATEMDATNAKGWYLFDVAQGEANADVCLFTGKSATANVSVVGQYIHTTPNRFTTLVIDAAGLADANSVKIGPTGAGTAQTARDVGASVLLSNGTGTGQLKLASGYVAMTWADIGTPTAAVALTGTTIATTQKVDVETIKTNPVVNAGTVTFPTTATLASTTNITAGTLTTVTTATNVTTVNGLAAGVITDASIAADAITDAKVAADVTIASVTGAVGSVTGAVGSVTGNVGGNVTGSVGSVASGGIASTSFAAGAIDAAAIATDAIGALELAAGAASEIATAVRSELTTELGRIDVATSTRLATASYTAPPSVGAIADQVWDETLSGHLGVGSTGEALNAAGAAGDPWTTALPGAYGAGSAGKIIGDNINATISSRATQTSVDTVDDFLDTEIAAIKTKTDNLPAAPAATGDCITAAGVRTAVGLATANMDTQLSGIAADAAAADTRGENVLCRATANISSTTTSITTSAFSPAGAAENQFKGRIVIFDVTTATAALRGQATDITASSNSATPTLTVTALTTAPALGDTFSVV